MFTFTAKFLCKTNILCLKWVELKSLYIIEPHSTFSEQVYFLDIKIILEIAKNYMLYVWGYIFLVFRLVLRHFSA
jgi:hypothetical protein